MDKFKNSITLNLPVVLIDFKISKLNDILLIDPASMPKKRSHHLD